MPAGARGGENGPVRLGLTRSEGPLPRPGWRALVLDALLAFALGLIFFQAATSDPGDERMVEGPLRLPFPPLPPPEQNDSDLGALLLVFVLCVPLILRRRYPLAVLWANIIGTLLVLVPDSIQRPNLYVAVVLTSLMAVYSAAAHSPYRRAVLISLPLIIAGVAVFREVVLSGGYVPFLILAPLVAWAGGHHVWKRRAGEDRKLLADQAHRQAEALRHAVADERARIARELHDVVTHHVSVMVIQAGAARSVLASEPEQAREALLAVESTGRSALTELRDVMGLLAPSGDGEAPVRRAELAELIGSGPTVPPVEPAPAELDPQPGLEALPALVRRMCAAGLPVTLAVAGATRPVSSGVELAAYRVVQEALTNTMRHAAGATAAVTLEYGPSVLRVEVSDTGGEAGPGVAGGGRGLIGLRERLAVYGGSLRAGVRPGATGYRVEALIPLEVP
jgi:signal transduction histidine kinase